MLLRARFDGPSAGDRVARLLDVPRGGWVPPAEDEVDALEQEPSEPEQDDRSWEPRPVGSRALPSRLRLDPGRRGAVALVVVAALAALLAAGVVLRGRPQEVAAPVLERPGAPLPGVSAAPDPAALVVVAVAGHVRRPGLVRLPSGSRVDDALRAAGGALPGTELGLLNLARKLTDGEQVLVGIEPPAGAASAAGGDSGGLLDLNSAGVGDLDALPGIGPVLAQRIVDWRTSHGPFASVDQLREVTGIGEAKYEDLRSKVVVP